MAASIVVVALIVRLIHLWQMRRAPVFSVLMGDARSYDTWAQAIAGGNWWRPMSSTRRRCIHISLAPSTRRSGATSPSSA
jgi:hypothetical protein